MNQGKPHPLQLSDRKVTNGRMGKKAALGLPLTILFALTLTGCEKAQREATTEERLKSVQQRQETQPEFFAPRNRVDYMADMKNIRDLPPAERAKAEAAKAAATATPTTPAPAPVTPTPAPVTQPATPAAQAPAATQPRPQATPTPAPVQPAPAPVVSTPAPAAAAPARAADTSVSVTNRESPSFPREAIRQGIESGVVRARVTINANGEPINVAILSARPARVFDREVQATLMRWRFNPGADGRFYETEINFQR